MAQTSKPRNSTFPRPSHPTLKWSAFLPSLLRWWITETRKGSLSCSSPSCQCARSQSLFALQAAPGGKKKGEKEGLLYFWAPLSLSSHWIEVDNQGRSATGFKRSPREREGEKLVGKTKFFPLLLLGYGGREKNGAIPTLVKEVGAADRAKKERLLVPTCCGRFLFFLGASLPIPPVPTTNAPAN